MKAKIGLVSAMLFFGLCSPPAIAAGHCSCYVSEDGKDPWGTMYRWRLEVKSNEGHLIGTYTSHPHYWYSGVSAYNACQDAIVDGRSKNICW